MGADIGSAFGPMENCGINAAVTVQTLCRGGREDCVRLVERLSGEGFSRVLSLEVIGRALEATGCWVIGVRGLDVAQAAGVLDHGAAAVVLHLGQSDRRGHFVALGQGTAGTLRVYDYPRRVQAVAVGHGDNVLTGQMSGTGLVVSSNAVSHEGILKWLKRNPGECFGGTLGGGYRSISRIGEDGAGEVVFGAGMAQNRTRVALSEEDNEALVAVVRLRNSGNSEVHLRSVRGECGCFRGAKDPGPIRGGVVEEIELRFSKSEFPKNGVARVALEFEGDGGFPGKRVVLVEACNARSPDKEKPFFGPDLVRFGLLRGGGGSRKVYLYGGEWEGNKPVRAEWDRSRLRVDFGAVERVSLFSKELIRVPVDVSLLEGGTREAWSDRVEVWTSEEKEPAILRVAVDAGGTW